MKGATFMRRVAGWQVNLTIVCVFLGFLLAWQYQVQASRQESSGTSQNTDLVSLIERMEMENQNLEVKIADLRQTIDSAQSRAEEGKSTLSSLEQTLRRLQVQAGLVPVEGPGIRILLDDNNAGAQAAKESGLPYNPEKFIIHDKDILYLVNELKAYGAEAIAVNGQRITNMMSDVRCVGTVILVNSTRLAPPFVIEAIGSPERLYEAVLTGSEYPYLKAREFPVSISQEELLTLPAHSGSINMQIARPVEGGVAGES